MTGMTWGLLLGTLWGCRAPDPMPGVTETGNPELDAGVQLQARSSDPGGTSVRGDGEVDVDGLWMSVGSVQLFAAEDCEDAQPPSMVEPFVRDATDPSAPVQRGRAEATAYCGALIRLEPADDPAAGPSELTEATLILTGTSEEQRPFEVRSSLVFEIPLSLDEGDFVIDDSHDRLDVGIDVSVWMDEISVDDGVPDPDGTIVISDTSNTALLRDFEEELLDAMDLEVTDN